MGEILRHAERHQSRRTVTGRRTYTVSPLKRPLVPVLRHQHRVLAIDREYIPDLRILQVHPGGILWTYAAAGRLARRRSRIARFAIHRHLAATRASRRTGTSTRRDRWRRRQRCRYDG